MFFKVFAFLAFCTAYSYTNEYAKNYVEQYRNEMEKKYEEEEKEKEIEKVEHVWRSKQMNEKEIVICFFDLVNKYRKKKSKTKLWWNDYAAFVAQQHSQDMFLNDTFNHDGFDDRFAMLKKRFPNFVSASENIYKVKTTSNDVGRIAYLGLINSMGHRENIEGDWNVCGVGIHISDNTYYFTQIFVKINGKIPDSHPIEYIHT